jgi:hypothetical protein
VTVDGRFQQEDNDFFYHFRDIGDTHKYSDQLCMTLGVGRNCSALGDNGVETE